jgi:prepilin-type N-terminal cleavage/methylation domain-containing protein
MTYRATTSYGFTLVELLIVISLVGILAGVTISVLNPVQQRRAAEDGVRQANLQKYALGIEAFANATGSYPVTVAFDPTTKVPTAPADLATFITRVPQDEPTAPLSYPYAGLADGSAFGVYVVKASDAALCYRYVSAAGKIKECPLAQCGGVLDNAACI